MNYRAILSICLAFCLIFSMAACAKSAPTEEETPPAEAAASPQPAADDDSAILLSDETAIDFLEGVWTNNRGQYLAPERGEAMLIVWSTNISLPPLSSCFLREGVLYGVGENGAILPLLKFQIEDQDTLRITNLNSEKTDVFLRETGTVDTSRLDNAYVFHSLRHACPYLSGMWLNEAGNYFILDVSEEGSITFRSDLPCPDVESVDFISGIMCGAVSDADGKTDIVQMFTFDIQDEDTVTVTSHLDESVSVFNRQSTNVEEALLHEDYVFSSSQRAYSFLNGTWSNEDDDYFTVSAVGGSLSLKTNLPLDDSFQSYTFKDGGLIGVSVDENGETTETPIYLFEIHSQNEITLTVCENDEPTRLQREQEQTETEP